MDLTKVNWKKIELDTITGGRLLFENITAFGIFEGFVMIEHTSIYHNNPVVNMIPASKIENIRCIR